MPKSRKPVDMQTKHLTKAERADKERAEQVVVVGREQLSRPPNWLVDSVAVKEFRRIIEQFDGIAVIGNLDLNNIASYCNAYSFYRKSTAELKSQPLIIEKPLPNGSKTLVENPLIKIQKNYAEEMRKFAGLCGLTIDSRLKVGAVATTQEDLDIVEDFGDI